MSQENVEVMAAAFDAFAHGGREGLAQHWTDDIKHRALEGAPDDHGPMHGKDALRAYVQDWLDMFDDFKAEPVELIDAGGDEVVAVIRDLPLADGREYATRDEALEAAGLEE